MPLSPIYYPKVGTRNAVKISTVKNTSDGVEYVAVGLGFYGNDRTPTTPQPSSGLYVVGFNSSPLQVFKGGLIAGDPITNDAEKHPFEHVVFSNTR